MKLLALVLLVLNFQTAKAALLLEPYGGYVMGSFDNKLKVTGATTSGTANGTGVGGRLAYKHNAFFIGPDYLYTSTTIKTTSPTGVADLSANSSMLFGDLGFDSHRLRIFGGYGFMNQLTQVNPGSSNVVFTGTAYKVGVGLHIMSFIAINAEYINSTYTRIKIGNLAETDLSNTYSTFNNSAYMFTLSIPFSTDSHSSSSSSSGPAAPSH